MTKKLISNHEVKYRQKDYKYWIKIDIARQVKKVFEIIAASKKIDIDNGFRTDTKKFVKHYHDALAHLTHGEKILFKAQAFQRLSITVKEGELIHVDDRTKREYYLYPIKRYEINIDEHNYGFGTNKNMQFRGDMREVLRAFAKGKKYEPKNIDNKLVKKLNFVKTFRAEPIHTESGALVDMIVGKHQTKDTLTIINYILPKDKEHAPVMSRFNIPIQVAKRAIAAYDKWEKKENSKSIKKAKKAFKNKSKEVLNVKSKDMKPNGKDNGK